MSIVSLFACSATVWCAKSVQDLSLPREGSLLLQLNSDTLSLCALRTIQYHVLVIVDDQKGNSPADQCFWAYSPKIISDPPLDTYLPQKQKTSTTVTMTNPAKLLLTSIHAQLLSIKWKMIPTVWGCVMIKKVALCNKEMAWSTNTPAQTERSTKVCAQPSLVLLRPCSDCSLICTLRVQCCWHLVQIALCTSLLVLLFGTHLTVVNQGSEWQL